MDNKTLIHAGGVIILGLLGLLYGLWSRGLEDILTEARSTRERLYFLETRQTRIEWDHKAIQERHDELRLDVEKLKETKR